VTVAWRTEPPREPAAAGPVDLRAPALGLVAWLAALAALLAPRWLDVVLLVVAVSGLLHRRRRGREVLSRVAWLLAALGVAASALLRTEAVQRSPVEALARDRAMVQASLVVTSDPVLRRGRFESYVVLRARTEGVSARGRHHAVRAPVLVIADERWHGVELGSEVSVAGRLERARTSDLAGVLTSRGPPTVRGRPGPLLDGAERLRDSIRTAVARQPVGPRALVPALVDGDDAGMPERLAEDFRAAGLTHLLAVSGTNLTLVVGSLLLLARWAGVRARGLMVVGALGVAGFVLLARTEPSVVRAAAMGSVGLLGMGHHGRRRGTRALGVVVLVLLLFDPWLAVSPGFALSVLATAGILWLAPGWRDRLMRWLPRWVAEAVSVPLAAQLACTPLVAAISGQVSLVAVVANLLAAPAVGPATVLGLLGGVVGLVSDQVGRGVATPAAWCARWIIVVAEKGAGLPVATIGWSAGPLGVGVLALLCVTLSLVLGSVLARRSATVGLAGVMVVALLVPLPTPGWPPRGWVMVACDVGQGDGVVLNAGDGAGLVVDAGPDPAAMDRCLRLLEVDVVPLVVLTHFHADHVDGLAGVLRGRQVGAVQVTDLAEPLSGVRRVQAVASRAGVPVQRAAYGTVARAGQLTWQVVAPSGPPSTDSGSPANDSSVVLLVQVRGIRILLLGDQEEGAQSRLWRETGGVRAEVLKVAHHGSASQDPDLVRGVGARLAVISVGRDNDYGHPAPSLMALLSEATPRVARTDEGGDVAVTLRHGELGVRERGARTGP
jgi:competence protein ComEC